MNWGELFANTVVFVLVSGWTFYFWQLAENKIRRRIMVKRLAPSGRRLVREEEKNARVAFTDMALKLGNLAKPKKAEEISKVARKLSWAGYRNENGVVCFYGVKLGGGMLLSGIFLMGVLFSGSLSSKTPLLMFLPFGMGYFLPDAVLEKKAKKRIEAIFQELPDTLDLLEVCLKAGLGFNYALYRVCSELSDISPVLSEEFGRYFLETKTGIGRDQALTNLGERNGSDPLKKVINVLLQSLKIGSDMAHALNVYTDTMRKERMQMAEEQGAKLSSKMTLPLVVFILPALMLIILGPVIISFLEIVRQGF